MRKHTAYEREEREYLSEDSKEKRQKNSFHERHGILKRIQKNMAF